MRKLLYNFLFGLLCALALFMLSACNGKTESVPNSNAESNQVYSGQFIYLTENTNKNLISIPIPLNDSFNQKTITFIEEFIENEIFIFSGENFDLKLSENNITDTEKEYSDYCIIMESKKLYNSGDIISMVFDGIFNKKSAAHPIHLLFSLNFNPKTLEIISFSDNYHIDKDLYNTFANIAEKEILESCNGKWPDGWGSFSEMFYSQEQFIESMQKEKLYYFYTPEGIGISYLVPHSVGDHIEIVIPYSKLKKNRIYSNN